MIEVTIKGETLTELVEALKKTLDEFTAEAPTSRGPQLSCYGGDPSEETAADTESEPDVPPPPAETTPPPPPAQETTETAPASTGPELDKDGMPWDERIHSGTKSKTQAGLWTKRRNVPAETYEAVSAELKQIMAAGTPAAETQADAPADVPPPPAEETNDAPPPPPAANDVPPPPPPPPADNGGAPDGYRMTEKADYSYDDYKASNWSDEGLIQSELMEAAPAAAAGPDWPTLMGTVSEAMADGKITQEQLDGIAQELGIPQFMRLNLKPELLGTVDAKVKAIINAG